MTTTTTETAPGARLDSSPGATTTNPQETPQEGMTMFAQTTSTREIVHAIADEYRDTADRYDYLATQTWDDRLCGWLLAAAEYLHDEADMAVDDMVALGAAADDTLPDALLWDDVAHALEHTAHTYRVRADRATGEYAKFLRSVGDDLDAAAARVRADAEEVLA